MTAVERRLLQALSLMCDQYLGNHNDDRLDHQCMSAGENAVEILVEYGLIEPAARGGTWTAAGLKMINA